MLSCWSLFFHADIFFLSKAQLCSALFKSRTDDVEARGGADLPRRSLCNEFTLLLLKPFKPFYVFKQTRRDPPVAPPPP